MTRFVKIAVTIGAVIALAVLPAAAASADQNISIAGATATYNTGTHALFAYDTLSDGKSAIAEIRAGSGATVYRVTSSNGVGSAAGIIVSMPARYELRACVQDIGGGGAKTCTGWVGGA